VNVKNASDLLPWKVTDISLRPHKDMWSMNSSIHFDGQLWRCILRCSDYAMPNGVTIRSRKAKSGVAQTKNVMAIFDPASWKPVEIYKMRESDDLERVSSSSLGYEDIRLFRTDRGGLQGIAASLHLRRDSRSRKQFAEQVLLTFDETYNIVDAQPIRGDAWGGEPQKNWSPFDNCMDPWFLYSIAEGIVFGDRGPLRGDEAQVRSSISPRPRAQDPDDRALRRARERAQEAEHARDREQRRRDDRARKERTFVFSGGTEGTTPLRGGTQLVRVGDDAWLGIGHAMKVVDRLKHYHHVWYLVDDRGRLKSASPPMKLAPNNGIEFAAGLAIDGDRVVVSFGVDDGECRIGETKLSAVLEMLRPIG